MQGIFTLKVTSFFEQRKLQRRRFQDLGKTTEFCLPSCLHRPKPCACATGGGVVLVVVVVSSRQAGS